MTTLASPSQGGAGQALWRVDMPPDRVGPAHAIDTEQIWTVLAGRATVELRGERIVVEAGDTLVIPADAPRRLSTASAVGLTAIVTAPAGMRAYRLDETLTPPADAVPDTDKLVPAWVC